MKNKYHQKFTELKKREPKRIELGLIDELKKFTKNLEKALTQIKSNKTKLGNSLKEIKQQRKEVEIHYNTAVKNKKAVDLAIKNSEVLAKEIAKQAKELGINPSQIKEVPKLVDLIRQVEGSQETIDMFINDAKGIVNNAALK